MSGADRLVVGASAGSVVGAQLTSGTELEALYERQLAPATGEEPARPSQVTFARFGGGGLARRDSRSAIGPDVRDPAARAAAAEAGRAQAAHVAVEVAAVRAA